MVDEGGRQAGQACFWSHLKEFGCHLLHAPGWALVIVPLISKSKWADKSLGSLFVCQAGSSELPFMSVASSGFLPGSAAPSGRVLGLGPKHPRNRCFAAGTPHRCFLSSAACPWASGCMWSRNNSIPMVTFAARVVNLKPVLTLRLCPL